MTSSPWDDNIGSDTEGSTSESLEKNDRTNDVNDKFRLSWLDDGSAFSLTDPEFDAGLPKLDITEEQVDLEQIQADSNLLFVTFSPIDSDEDEPKKLDQSGMGIDMARRLFSQESWLPTPDEAPFLYDLPSKSSNVDLGREISEHNDDFQTPAGTTKDRNLPQVSDFDDPNEQRPEEYDNGRGSSDAWLRFRVSPDLPESVPTPTSNERYPAKPSQPTVRPITNFWRVLERTAALACGDGEVVRFPRPFELGVPTESVKDTTGALSQAEFVSQVKAVAVEVERISKERIGELAEGSELDDEQDDNFENHPYFDTLAQKHEAFQASGAIDTDLEKSHKRLFRKENDDMSISSRRRRRSKP